MSSILKALERARQERERGHAHQRPEKNVLLPVDPAERLLDRPAPPHPAAGETTPHPYAPAGLAPSPPTHPPASPPHHAAGLHAHATTGSATPHPRHPGFPVWAALLMGTMAGLALVLAGMLAFLAGLGAREPGPSQSTAAVEAPAQASTPPTPASVPPVASPLAPTTPPATRQSMIIDDESASAAVRRLEADPFVSMVVAGQPSPPPTPTPAPTPPPAQVRRMHADDFTAFRIDGVMMGGRTPLVMIMGRDRTVGDVVQGYEILQITPEFIALAHEGTHYELRY